MAITKSNLQTTVNCKTLIVHPLGGLPLVRGMSKQTVHIPHAEEYTLVAHVGFTVALLNFEAIMLKFCGLCTDDSGELESSVKNLAIARVYLSRQQVFHHIGHVFACSIEANYYSISIVSEVQT